MEEWIDGFMDGWLWLCVNIAAKTSSYEAIKSTAREGSSFVPTTVSSAYVTPAADLFCVNESVCVVT